MAIPLDAMAASTLILFLDEVLELIEERIWFKYFSGFLVDSFCSLCLFFREIKRKVLIGNEECRLITLCHFENYFIDN